MSKHRHLVILILVVVTLQAVFAISVYNSFDTLADRGAFGDMFGVVNTLFSGFAFAGVIYAIFLQANQLELQKLELELTRKELARAAEAQESAQKTLNNTMLADHDRRRKQATIDYMRAVRPIWSKGRRALNDAFGNNNLSDGDIEKIDADKDLQRLVREVLSWLEHLSVGANTEVFDKDMIYRMSGSYLIRIYRRMSTYIESAQVKNQYAYVEFRELIHDFEEQRRLRPDPRGRINHAYTPEPINKDSYT
ncbi:DUF4760 domain-containing protein [Thiocapsa bogorovii]|uniref:DUF4760 domain-containing protein n=1 Tax=Thiocapsa bogorovii TaxID=521689 RepID=UPI001E40D571|nr:DUF4760 domain-containing protein [Thiocapsa bogorovii]UHD17959.1 DUF4760 domain-containing protein [Thiocapsa bogorovii]